MTVVLSPPTATTGRTTASSSRPRWVTDVVAIGALIAVWELLARTVFAGAYTLSAPSAIVRQIASEFDLYWRNMLYTTANAAWGFLWGNLVAVGLAAAATLLPVTRRTVNALALTVFCLPLVALAPILRVVLGPGDTTAIALAAIAVFFTTYIATLLGLDSASSSALQVVRSYGRGRGVEFTTVRMRSSMPALFAGLQVAAPAAFLGALVGEFTGASRGLGVLTISALRTLETDRVWAVATVSTLVSVGAYALVGAIGHRVSPWAAGIDVTSLPRTRRTTGIVGRLVGALVPVAAVLLGWVGFLWIFDVNTYFAKTPIDVWNELVVGPDAAEMRDLVLPALWSTLGVTAIGFVVGLAAGVVLAVLFVSIPPIERMLLPVAVALRAVPIIATMPVIILLFGRGLLATIVIVAVMSFFPTLVNCAAAMRRTPSGILDVLATYDAGMLARARVGHLPTAVPALLASARIAVPTSLLAATVAEWLATGRGIGNVMIVASGTARYDTLWVCVVVLTLAAVVGYSAVGRLETTVLGRISPERSA